MLNKANILICSHLWGTMVDNPRLEELNLLGQSFYSIPSRTIHWHLQAADLLAHIQESHKGDQKSRYSQVYLVNKNNKSNNILVLFKTLLLCRKLMKKSFSSWVSKETRSIQYSLQKFLPSNQSPFNSSNPCSFFEKK